MLEKSHHKILITGGAGYIGSVLTRKALARNFSVNLLDQIVISELRDEPNLSFFEGSITDLQVLAESLENVDFVIHLAGISDGRAGKENPALTKKINVDALTNIMEASKRASVKRFVFASTMGVYGNRYQIPLTEDLPLAPIDPYSESKAVGEEIVRAESDECFITTSLRIAMVYGSSPRLKKDFVVNRMTLDALEKNKITILGGVQKRPQVYLEDLANIFLEVLSADARAVNGESFNVVGLNPTISEIAESVGQRLPQTQIEVLPSRNIEDSFEMSGEKTQRVFKYCQEESLDKGIDELIRHYQA